MKKITCVMKLKKLNKTPVDRAIETFVAKRKAAKLKKKLKKVAKLKKEINSIYGESALKYDEERGV